MKHAPGFLKLVHDAKKKIVETNIAEVKQRMDAGDPFLLIDVREDREWDNGRIPKAVHLGKGIIERDIEAKVPDHSQEIILYCGGGFRSALSADALQQMGYTNVKSMDGGFRSWKEAGLQIVKE